MASKINLISYDNSAQSIPYGLLDQNGLNEGIINGTPSSQLENFVRKRTQPLIYGDRLVYFLGLLKEYIRSHEHKDAEGPPIDGAGKISELLKYPLESLKSTNIRIN